MIRTGKLTPQRLVGKTLSLEEGCSELPNMDSFTGLGVKVITP
jgi:alcohol dehydrogenase